MEVWTTPPKYNYRGSKRVDKLKFGSIDNSCGRYSSIEMAKVEALRSIAYELANIGDELHRLNNNEK